MDLPKLTNLDVEGKRVIVRADLDVSVVSNEYRLEAMIPMLKYLAEKNTKVVVIGHRGRPASAELRRGKPYSEDGELSLKPVAEKLEKLLEEKIGDEAMQKLEMNVMENLRFNLGEEANDQEYAKHLADHGDVYINEAFSVSHREHASIIALPMVVKKKGGQVGFGLQFVEEIKHLSKVKDNAKPPVVVIISGVKKDKLGYVEDFKRFADKILIAGRLPEHMREDINDPKLVVAKLSPDREDITMSSIEKFEKEISGAGTIVVSGPIGKFEDEGHRQGTKRVFEAVSNSSAFKVAGGGDTNEAISLLGIRDKFDWVSIGGGAMLEYLAKGTLPGIEAII